MFQCKMWLIFCIFINVIFIVITAPSNPYFNVFAEVPSAAAVYKSQVILNRPKIISITIKNTEITRGPLYTINTQQDQKHPYIEVRNATYHGLGPREEARAMCAVKTQEVNATANATITRRLHGVVTSRELNSAIQRLEVIIFGQMQQLWQSLDALRSQLTSSPRITYPDRRSISFRFRPNTL